MIRKILFLIHRSVDQFIFERFQLADLFGGKLPDLPSTYIPSGINLGSEIVSERRFLEADFLYWMRFLRESPRLHSKQFQFYAIMDRAFGIKLSNDHKPLTAIGFGVGKEPIPSALVALGFSVIATDYLDGENANAWRSTGQQSQALLDLNQRKLVTDVDFLRACEFVNMDMNEIPESLDESFDFVWSSCALGHIGSYEKGLDFIIRSLRLLKPGGWAVHTTEIDRSDIVEKFESPGLSFYKLQDLEELVNKSEKLGFNPLKIEKGCFDGVSEKYVVSEPWGSKPHLRIEIFEREINSVVIQIQKPR
jgi:hypothetical protein